MLKKVKRCEKWHLKCKNIHTLHRSKETVAKNQQIIKSKNCLNYCMNHLMICKEIVDHILFVVVV